MKNSLARPLAESDSGVFALDSRRTIVFCNSALGNWLGIEPEQLLGRTCDYHSREVDDDVGLALSSLAPPPEALTGQVTESTVRWTIGERSGGPRRVRFSLLPRHGEPWLLAVLDVKDLSDDETVASNAAGSDWHRRLRVLRTQIQRRYRSDRLLGESAVARRLREQVRIAVDSGARVLLVGPPGSGREHLARVIHGGQTLEDQRQLLPLVCPLLDPELLEAAIEAFQRQEVSPGPTVDRALLLLDVDQLPIDGQQLLVDMLPHGRHPLRTLSTARQPLLQLAAEGTFRSDLAEWLSPMTIELPPLAARRADLPMLAQAALEEFNAHQERQFSGILPDALELLAAHNWPENLDELQAVVAAACRRAHGTMIAVTDLPESLRRAVEPARPERTDEPIVLDTLLADIEREVLARALRRCKGNKARAARLLGLSRPRLLRRIEQLGLQ